MSSLSDRDRLARTRRERQKIAAWLETRRGKPQYRPAPPAGRSVAKIVKPLSKKFAGSSSALRLVPHWPNIIGARWAKFSRPEKFIGNKNGKTLVISAPGPAAALIMASAGPILERTNIYMGEGVVRSLKVIQTKIAVSSPNTPPNTAPQNGVYSKNTKTPPRGLTPSEEDALQSGLRSVKEDRLKIALSALGRNVMRQNHE